MPDYGEFFEKLPDGVTIHDPADGSILATNQQFCEMLGYTREEMLDLDFSALHVDEGPYTDERAREYIADAATEGPQTFEWVDETKGGDRLPVEVHLRQTEVDGEERILAVVRDISERKHQEERFQAFIEHSMDIISVLDADGRFIYQSPSVKRWLGYAPAAVVGDVAFEYVHPEDREQVQAEFARGLANPDVTPTVEYRFQHRDGSWRWLESIGTNELSNPAIEGVVVNSRDITQRKRHQQRMTKLHDVTRELMAAETRTEIASVAAETATALLGIPNSAIYLHNEPEGTLVPAAVAESTRELVGTPPTFEEDEGVAGRVFESGTRARYADVREAPEVYNPETPIRSEMVLPLGDHGVFMVGSTEVDDFDEEDVALAGVLAANLETALDRAERGAKLRERSAELRRQNERLDNFASFVSHDLRNPLSVARSRVELAADDCDSPHLEKVEDAHRRMEGVIEDLLRLARETESVNDPDPVSLPAVLDSCWTSISPDSATLSVETDQTIFADRARLERLVANLLKNADQHGGEAVTVVVGETDGGFYVADDGPGIPPDQRERVFESGYSTRAEGTGIGLSLVDEIATAHDWDVTVTEAEIGGARFDISGVDIF